MIRTIRISALNVAFAYVLVSLAVLMTLAAPLWYSWHKTIEQGRTEQLSGDIHRMQRMLVNEGPQKLASVIQVRVGDQMEDFGKVLLMAGPAFEKIAGNLDKWPPNLPEAQAALTLPLTVDGHRISVALVHATLPGGYHLLVGRNVDRFEHLEALFVYALIGCGVMVVGIGLAGGLFLRRVLLSKVDGIRQTTSAIMQGDLARRLPEQDHDGEELQMLAHTVNRMLEQIEQLVHGLRNVSNAIAHDLRTPLTELRSRLEELSVTRPPPDEAFMEIEEAIADVDRVIGIFNALLRLAEIDSGIRRSGFVTLDAGKLACEVAEFYQPLAELKGIRLGFSCDQGLVTTGDPLLLAQSLSNLVENAFKFAPQQGRVEVRAARVDDRHLEIVVADNGPGISDEDKPRVTERFYRGDVSRGTAGVGLGLSLVASVAKLHGGDLEFGDNAPGLRVTLRLPAESRALLPTP